MIFIKIKFYKEYKISKNNNWRTMKDFFNNLGCCLMIISFFVGITLLLYADKFFK